MSGAMNPLAAGAPGGATDNALSSGPIPPAEPQPGQAPTVAAALAHIAGGAPSPQQLTQGMQRGNYLTQELATLVKNPDVTRRDVLKATSDAVGTRHISAEEGIQFLAQMPSDPTHLRPWLQQMYRSFLVGSVAAHAYGHAMVAGQ